MTMPAFARTIPGTPRTGLVRVAQSALRSLPAMFLVGLVTFICFTLRSGFSTASFFYLIVVVLQSLAGDFYSSVFVSIASFLCLNYFFVVPIFSFRVNDASDTVALVSFLVSGLVITRLTSRARDAAASEKRQQQETTRLYELAQELLALEPGTTGAKFLRPFKEKFGLCAVSLFDAVTAKLHLEGDSLDHLAEKTRSAYISKSNYQDHRSGVAVRLLQTGGGTGGAIGFEGLREIDLTANPLATLAAVMVERSNAFQKASRAAAATETEVFRGAVLDALAHEFKTPLATILAAAGGLREAGPLRLEQQGLVDAVESETSRLEQLTSRLLRLARLDRQEVEPQMELISLSDVVRSMVEQHAAGWPDRCLVLLATDRFNVVGDRELLWLGLGQLLDNACKYSRPGSEITVSMESANGAIAVHVWNSGDPIPSSERARIFDRFYRGVAAQRLSPGSGLGLYVARKIALAHGGTLDLEEPTGSNGGIAFRFTIPISRGEMGHDTEIQSTAGR